MAEAFNIDRLLQFILFMRIFEKMEGGAGGETTTALTALINSLQTALSNLVDKAGALVDRVVDVKEAVVGAVNRVEQALDKFKQDASKIVEKLDQLAQSSYILVRVKDVYAKVGEYEFTFEVVGA